MLAPRRGSSSSVTRVASISSLNSTADSFHTVVDSPAELDSEERVHRPIAQSRKDSGYSGDLRKPLRNDSGRKDDFFDLTRLQRELDQLARRNELRSQQRHCRNGSTSPPDGTRRSRRPSDAKRKPPKAPSRKQSSNLTSPTSSVYGRMRGSKRTASINSPISDQDPYVVSQRARELIQSLQRPDGAPTPMALSRTVSVQESYQCVRPINGDYSAMASTVELEPQEVLSPLYTATHIDWTDPDSRREAYEKHERGQRGIRGFLRRITPRRWQTQQLDFYDGASDAGSVRRYRLDLNEKDTPVPSAAMPGRPELRARHTFTCLPLQRSSSRMEK